VTVRYTCQGCGLVVRAEAGQAHKVCACAESQAEEPEGEPETDAAPEEG
jgi:hypothetical protein